jgi:hypothetical protein
MILIAKLIVSVGLLALMLVAVRSDLSRFTNQQFTFASTTGLAVMRFAVFTLVYGVLNLIPQSDNVGYYSEAKAALAGGIIYRDFASSYGPLFTWLDAVAVYLWNSPKSIVLFAIVVELISFPLWLYVSRRAFNETVTRRAALLYVLSPVPFFVTGINGQNQVFGAAYLAAVILLFSQQRELLAAFVMGLAIPGVKFLMALFAPVTVVFANQKVAFVLALLSFPIIFYVGLFFVGADLWGPFRIQVDDQTSGNIPFFVSLVGLNAASSVVRRGFDLFTAACVGAVFLMHTLRTRTKHVSWVIDMFCVIGLTLLLCSKKSYTNYLVLFYFPLCLSTARASFSAVSAAQFGLFNLIATLVPSLSFRWITNSAKTSIPSIALLSRFHELPLYISVSFILINLALVAFYIRFIVMTSRLMIRDRSIMA